MKRIFSLLLCLIFVVILNSQVEARPQVTKYYYDFPAQPLVTGQTVSYTSGTTAYDDGDLESGVTRDYTVLTTGQYAGTTNITINAKTIAMENACTIDNQSGLMWMSRTPDSDIGPGNDGKLYWSIDVDENIWQFLVEANANSLGGHNDWRVPNYFELVQILDVGQNNPCINTTAFPSTPSDYFWTSSTSLAITANAFIINFGNSTVTRNAKRTVVWYVRLVRDAD